MKICEKDSKEIVVKSKLPGADYVINPYIGCSHHCIYCYASFMKRFSKHEEEWGEFVDVKVNYKAIKTSKYDGKVLLFGSVTDPYQHAETKYHATRKILEQIVEANCKIEILTKSDLVLNDIDIIKEMKNVSIGVSMNTLDDRFRRDMEPYATSIRKRIELLKKLKESGIKTYLFISPIFPGITNLEELILNTKEYVSYYCFENLNLRAGYKAKVLSYIKQNYSRYYLLYEDIYKKGDNDYWESMKENISMLAEKYGVSCKVYFYHERIKKGKMVVTN